MEFCVYSAKKTAITRRGRDNLAIASLDASRDKKYTHTRARARAIDAHLRTQMTNSID